MVTTDQGEHVDQAGARTPSDCPDCPICLSPLYVEDDAVFCPECRTVYHRACWEENHGCAVYGCKCVPETEGLSELEIPVSHWGQENKSCPSCGRRILAAALRCSQCGATFESSRPLSGVEFENQKRPKDREPILRKGAFWFFGLTLLTCTAPIATIIGFIWFRANKEDLKRAPRIYYTLTVMGLSIGAFQTAFIILAMIIVRLRQVG